MTSEGIRANNMVERLPFLLERAAELGVPVQVRPHISRTGVDHVVVAATVTIHADVGMMSPTVDVEEERQGGRLDGTWLQVVGEQDLEFAANLRRHRIVDAEAGGIEPATVQTYTLSRAVTAAAGLLLVDLQQDEIPDAVTTRALDAFGPVEELTVDWAKVTAPTRSHGAVTLALIARSLLHGEPVDVSPLAHVHPDYAGAAEHAFAQLASAGRQSAGSWLAEDEQLGEGDAG